MGLDTGHDRNKVGPAPLGFREFESLIDTGSSVRCTARGLALELRLPQVGVQGTSGIGGSEAVPLRLAQIDVPLLHLSKAGTTAAPKLSEGGRCRMQKPALARCRPPFGTAANGCAMTF